jgi:UDP-N-acetylmuramate--alanine ligase
LPVSISFRFPTSFDGLRVHLVGIKGTGMTALAEVLLARGARITGSDTAEKFYTDAVLDRLGIRYEEGFAASNLPADAQIVVHSAAYRHDENPELRAAAERGIGMLLYPEALGLLSLSADATGICGVHGKSTTTALCGTILKEWKFPATVIVGAEVPGYGNRSTIVQGERYLVAETCEYRRHFLNFHPARIVMTSIEPDHLDYFRDLEDMFDAFQTYALSLPPSGTLVYCHDDAGAREVSRRVRERRSDIVLLPYGRQADGPYRVVNERLENGRSWFSLAGGGEAFSLRIPGEHNVLNAVAALCASDLLWRTEKGELPADRAGAARALDSFAGSRRRSEIIGEAHGVLVMDDYAHHPTAIQKTLAGIKAFHPGRRIIVDFMSHTYSRTQALLPELGRCFGPADVVILHKIYASARESNVQGISGRDLFAEARKSHENVMYFEEPLDALPYLVRELRPGDLLLTMGAGDNWKLGRAALRALEETA